MHACDLHGFLTQLGSIQLLLRDLRLAAASAAGAFALQMFICAFSGKQHNDDNNDDNNCICHDFFPSWLLMHSTAAGASGAMTGAAAATATCTCVTGTADTAEPLFLS